MRFTLISLFALSLVACAGYQTAAPASLYQRLGGQPGITAAVDLSLQKAAADPVLKDYFIGADAAAVGALIAEQLCDLSGGPCEYAGRTMRAAHAGMGITDAEFDAMAAHMKNAMTELSVAPREQAELLMLVETLRPQIAITR